MKNPIFILANYLHEKIYNLELKIQHKQLSYKYQYRLSKKAFTPSYGPFKGNTNDIWCLEQQTKNIIDSILDLSFEWFKYLFVVWITKAMFMIKEQAYNNLKLLGVHSPSVFGDGKHKVITHIIYPKVPFLFNLCKKDLDLLYTDAYVKYEVTEHLSDVEYNPLVYTSYDNAIAKMAELNTKVFDQLQEAYMY